MVVRFLLGLAVMGAVLASAGCLGSPSCMPNTKPPKDHEPPSADYNFCGTTLRWTAADDHLEVVRVGDHLMRWDQWNLSLPTPPNLGTEKVAVAFNAAASQQSPAMREGIAHPATAFAKGTMVPGHYLSFCRLSPKEATPIHISVDARAGSLGGFIILYTQTRPC